MTTNLKAGSRAKLSTDATPPRRARSPEAKDQVRQALINAGRELLLTKPSEPISLRGIARHAHYSSGVIYRYFSDKDDLLLAIRDSEMTNFIDKLEANVSNIEDSKARLIKIAELAFEFARYQVTSFGMNSLFLFWLEKAGSQEEKKPLYDSAPSAKRIHAFFENAVRSVMNPDTMTHGRVQVAVGALMASITGAMLLPGGSDHADLPDGHEVMKETISALINNWQH